MNRILCLNSRIVNYSETRLKRTQLEQTLGYNKQNVHFQTAI